MTPALLHLITYFLLPVLCLSLIPLLFLYYQKRREFCHECGKKMEDLPIKGDWFFSGSGKKIEWMYVTTRACKAYSYGCTKISDWLFPWHYPDSQLRKWWEERKKIYNSRFDTPGMPPHDWVGEMSPVEYKREVELDPGRVPVWEETGTPLTQEEMDHLDGSE